MHVYWNAMMASCRSRYIYLLWWFLLARFDDQSYNFDSIPAFKAVQCLLIYFGKTKK